MTEKAPPRDAFDAGLTIAAALESAAIPYCLGGALAYGQYGIPRATKAVDVNVFLEPDRISPALLALERIGVRFSDDPIRDARAEGLIVGHWHGYRVDVFTPSIDFSWEAQRTARTFELEGQHVAFLSAEALSVFKLLFFRGKDLVDLERLVAVSADDLDGGYVRAHIVAMMGEDDERSRAWDRIWAGRPE